ncbi:hypothetical protein D5F01_LYC19701 [Larimichthys crocea]|uniref:Uncharacterized protein n=1 Tax=Larimichthys crocea TaxID=215358 RepID=A0A6G0HT84_LARCR|nr:hypothetical protein D5F01_LYC19701 [Larimichthys crocea]
MEHTGLVGVIRPRIKLHLDFLSGHQWIRLVTGFPDNQTVELIADMCEDVIDVCLKTSLRKRSPLSNTPYSPLRPNIAGQPVSANQCLGYSFVSAVADVVGVSGCDDSEFISDLNEIMNEELAERLNSQLKRSWSSDELSEPGFSPSSADRLSRMLWLVLDLLKTLAIHSCSGSRLTYGKHTNFILDVNSESTTEEGLYKWDKASCGSLVGGFVHCCMKNASFKLSKDKTKSIITSITQMLWTEISGSDIPVKPYGKGMRRTIKATHMDLCKALGGAGTLRLSLLTEEESVSNAVVEILKRHLMSPQKNHVKEFFKVLRKNVAKLFTACFRKK